MSGLLSGLIAVVGIIGAIYTGGALGIVAGALLATSFAASQGWLGKGAQNFANSAAGHDITMAVGLASAAVALGGAISSVQAGAQSATVASANSAAETTEATATSAGGAAADAAPVAGV